MTAQPNCAHCQQPITGYGTVNDAILCHPDVGLDCYHLVTLYRHDTPCEIPYCIASVERRRHRETNSAEALNENSAAL